MLYQPIRSAADVQQRLIVRTTKENHWLDFKSALGGDGPENARDVAQFANASGGTLVIGALESARILTGFDNVPKPATVIAQVEASVGGNLTPVPIIEPYIIEAAHGKNVVVVNVPPSIGLVALHGRRKE